MNDLYEPREKRKAAPRLDAGKFSGKGPSAPIAELLGMTLVEMGAGSSSMEMIAEARHANPMGTLHGGVLCDLTDAAMGMALASTLQSGESFTTLELKTNFLRPFWQGRLRAHGRLTHRGKTVAMVEADVLDEQERLIARSSSTCMILRGDLADGR